MTQPFQVNKKVLLYIVYGNNEGYYSGAIFSILSFLSKLRDNSISILVLTEKPKKFESLPVKILKLSKDQINEWSLNNRYHFRIKNRGMAYVMDTLGIDEQYKILFFDTDTYFQKNPKPLFDLINTDQALFFRNEGKIYSKRRFKVYVENLKEKEIQVDSDFVYSLRPTSSMWGSLMVGLHSSMRNSLEIADKLMLEFKKIVPAHTIEPFSLSEVILTKYNLVEGKKYVSNYSTSGKKQYALSVINNFLSKEKNTPIDSLIKKANKLNLRRNLITIIRQRIKKNISK